MNPFDLHIEHRFRIDHHPQPLIYERCQRAFALQTLLGELLAKICALGKRLQLDQLVLGFIEDIRPQRVNQHHGQWRIGLKQPAAEGNAIGLVVDPVRVKLVQLGEHRAAHQLRVQSGNAVDTVGTEKRQIAHPHPAAMLFFNQGHGTQHIEIMHPLVAQ